MESKQIIHVHMHEPFDGEQDYYFGSLAAIFEVLPDDAVGTTYGSLRCRFARLGYRFINHRCTIRRGKVYRKKTNKDKMNLHG